MDHFIRGKHTISSQGGVRCSLSVLREEWEAECYYSGRGERRTITTQGGVGDGCNSKHCRRSEKHLENNDFGERLSLFRRLFFLIRNGFGYC